MRIKFKNQYLIGILVGMFLIVVDVAFLIKTRWFWAFLVVSLVIASIQFWLDFFNENKRQKKIEESFLEFVRNLVETTRSGISIPQSILHIEDKDYGPLTPYIRKLASQIRLGIPIHEALFTFANDTSNRVIKRSISIVIEAEESGGDIEDVLESVTNSVYQVKKINEERRASVYNQVVQGYIIFFVFIGIMLVLQLKLFPTLLAGGGGDAGVSLGIGGTQLGGGSDFSFDKIFTSLIVIQGIFVGLMIGKFSEGAVKFGIKHSLILVVSALLIMTTVKGSLF